MSEVNFNRRAACRNCTEDIFSVHTVLIRCAVCPDSLELCPDCHAAGAAIGQHQPDHQYTVIDNGGFALMSSEWTAREHIRLLDNVEQYGYGNWEDIVRKVGQDQQQVGTRNVGNLIGGSAMVGGTPRTADETRDEFCNNFIHGPVGRRTWDEELRGRARDHTQANPLLPPPSAPSEPPPNLSLTESIMLGYMAKRDDFEVEYDNEAEGLVAQLTGGPSSLMLASAGGESDVGEDELDVALKIAHVDMYKFKLRERERRRRVAREHQLISQFFKENPVSSERRSAGQKSRKKDKADLTERLKIVAEFQGVAEHQGFMASIAKEKELKSRTKDLMRFRKNGITSLKESVDYESQRLRRIKRKNELRRRQQQQQQEGALAPAADNVNSPMSIKSEDLSNGGSPMPGLGAGIGSAATMSPAAAKEEKLNISHLPGHEILSANEKKLCASLRLTPAHYITYKTCLLTHHLQKKKGQTPKPLNPEGLDKSNRKIIFQFLMRAGWITAY